MFKKVVVFCVFYLFTLSECGLLEGIEKCSVYDDECNRKLFQYIGWNLSKTGIPQLTVPILDPIQLKDITINIKNILNITLVEGEAEGISKCFALKYSTDMKTKMKVSEVLCNNITISGRYKLSPEPLLETILGAALRGDGKVNVELEKWDLTMTFPFKVERHENGEVYMNCTFEKADYVQSFGDIKVFAENIILGDQDISEMVVDTINKNWSSLLPAFGRSFSDEAVKFYYMVHDKFFDRIPTKNFYKEDLSSYVDD